MNPVDAMWVLVAAALVFTMQMGFLCLEAGFTRAKNAINVAMKNALNFMITTVVFYLFAFGLMFGSDWHGLVGLSNMAMPFRGDHLAYEAMFYVFQLMFCATSAAIVSGAVAERMHLVGYGLTTLMVAGLIYPVYGHWVWGQGLDATHSGFLGSMGFIDFAGSSVVHSGGGWVSLAGVLVLGQRTGRFDAQGRPVTIPGSNVPFATMGMLMLFFGWIGFNGGSTLHLNERVPVVITNTLVAGCCGCLAAIIIDRLRTGLVSPEALINGAIAGLVAITANCHVVDTPSAMVIGAIGGVIMLVMQEALLKLRIDDAVGAIPAHLGPGIWGTLAVGLFGDTALIGTHLSRMDQIWVQCTGILVCGAWCFGVGFLILWITNRIKPLRISVEDEYKGLNVTEHGATTELIDLLRVMEEQERTADLSRRAPEEPFTEVGQIAKLYNRVLDSLERATARASAIVRDMRDAVLTLAPTGVVMSLNPAAQHLFGKTENELRGTLLQTLLYADANDPRSMDLIQRLHTVQQHAGDLDAEILECLARTASGPCPVEVTFGKAMDHEEGFLTAVIRDVRTRRQALDQLYAEKRLAEFALQTTGDAVVRCDKDRHITYMNPIAEGLTGMSMKEAFMHPLAEVVQLSTDEAGNALIDPLTFSKQRPEMPHSEYYWLVHRDGTLRAVTFSAAAIPDAHGQLTGYVLVVRDMSEQYRITRTLSDQADHDQLTGLANRRKFEREVESALAMARDMNVPSPGSVLAFIDLDRFKIVNDTCGHLAGDALLKDISNLLNKAIIRIRNTDLLARLGGDEFAVLLRDCPMDKAVELANGWLQALRSFRFHWNGRTFSVGASIGLVRLDGSSSLKQVLADADAACYAAKTAGRDQVHVYQQDDRQLAALHREQSWAQRITEALEQRRFRLYTQQVMPTGATPHLLPFQEVMVRMVVENEEIISPEAFLPAAERFNLASAIDRCVIEEFFSFLSSHPIDQLHGPYSLNLSGLSLEDKELLDEIERFLQQHPRLHGLIWFEMTEQHALSRFDDAVSFMQTLARYGCRFTIDHFGTSSGSISQLGMLPVHILKFDPQLIVHAIANEDRFRLVLALNQLAHALEMYSVVKFIEDQATLERVKRFGVDYVQGLAVAPIVPLKLSDEAMARKTGSGDGH
jgi:Amt family ammonium transporter